MNTMNRRGFIAALGFAGVPVALVSLPTTAAAAPYAAAPLHCPACGLMMLITTRHWEKSQPHDPDVWTCGGCERSWRVEPQRVAATEVAYDSGTRRL